VIQFICLLPPSKPLALNDGGLEGGIDHICPCQNWTMLKVRCAGVSIVFFFFTSMDDADFLLSLPNGDKSSFFDLRLLLTIGNFFSLSSSVAYWYDARCNLCVVKVMIYRLSWSFGSQIMAPCDNILLI